MNKSPPSPSALPEAAAEEGRIGKTPERETKAKNFMERYGEFSCQSAIDYPVGKPLEVICNSVLFQKMKKDCGRFLKYKKK